jgi:hypothetical protein
MAKKEKTKIQKKKVKSTDNKETKKYFFRFVESNNAQIVLLILSIILVVSSFVNTIFCYLGKGGDFGSSFFLFVPSVILLLYCFKSKLVKVFSKMVNILTHILIVLYLLFGIYAFGNDIIIDVFLAIMFSFIVFYLILLIFKNQKIMKYSQLFNIALFFFILRLLAILLIQFMNINL